MKTRSFLNARVRRMIVALVVLAAGARPVLQAVPAPLTIDQARAKAPDRLGALAAPPLSAASDPNEVRPAVPLVDPFGATSWSQAASSIVEPLPTAGLAIEKVAKPADPAPPSAPPLPFVYIGRYSEAGRQIAMLMRGDQLLLLQQGETVDNMYRVEKIATDRIELAYLPLGTRQSVRIPDSD